MEDSELVKLREDVNNLEDDTPVINERLANNELEIQKLETRFEEMLSKPSADVSALEQGLKRLQIQVDNVQNSQLGVNRVKILVDEAQETLSEQVQRLQKKVQGIDEKSDRAFGLKAEIELKSEQLDQIVHTKLKKAEEQMLRNAEKVEDDVR